MYYAGIGSRETPKDVLSSMTKLADDLWQLGWNLRSGGADGADKAFEAGAHQAKQIYTANSRIPEWTYVFTDFFHPNPSALSPYARKLMNRNAMQILGANGNDPVEFVACWTEGGKLKGGTAQALRIAKFYNIPVYNLALDGALEALYANH